MALYIKRQGEFVKLTREQARRYRRVQEVVAIQKTATGSANTLLALAAWLEEVEKRAGKMDHKDFAITKAPNIDRIRKQARSAMNAARALQWV